MITTDKIPSLVKLSILTQVPLLLLGPHGVGKSSSIKLALQENTQRVEATSGNSDIAELEALFGKSAYEPILSSQLTDYINKLLTNIQTSSDPILKEWSIELETAISGLSDSRYARAFSKLNLSAYELLADILYPTVKDNKYYHVPLERLYAKILFLDEINRANRMILRSMLEVVLAKELGSEKMHWLTVVAAGNYTSSEMYDVEELDIALLDRFSVQYVQRNPKFILLHAHKKIVPDITEINFEPFELDLKRKNKSERAYAFASRVYYVEEILGNDLHNYIPNFDETKKHFLTGILGEIPQEPLYDERFFIDHEPNLETDQAIHMVILFCKYIDVLPEDVVQKWLNAILEHWTARFLVSETLFPRVKKHMSPQQLSVLLRRIKDLSQEGSSNG